MQTRMLLSQYAGLAPNLVATIRKERTLQNAATVIQTLPLHGPFIAYEVISDLRWTTLLAKAPLAGPVRLRQVAADPVQLERLAAALEDAMELFALAPWAPGAEGKP